jgi:hypothetical protein
VAGPSSNWWSKPARCEDKEVEATMTGKLKTMPTSPLSVVLQHLLADLKPEGAGMTDGELLTGEDLVLRPRKPKDAGKTQAPDPPKAKKEPPVAKGEEKQAMTKEEKLRVLINQVLAAHGGEDKLTKFTSFTMTVKHSNGETQQYFVQPPKNFRWETTHRDRTGTRIVCRQR